MHDSLPVDEVAGLFDLAQQLVNVAAPVVQNVVHELFLLEVNYAFHAVNLRHDASVDDHISNFVLGTLDTHTNQLAQALQADTSIELLDDAKVVLDDLSDELLVVLRVVLRFCAEWLEVLNRCTHVCLV